LKIEDVKVIGVVGAGIMGRGIAQTCAQVGYTVHLIDVEESLLEKALKQIAEGPFGLATLVEKGKLSPERATEILNRIKTTTDYDEFCKELDFVIEAVPEDVGLKKSFQSS